MASVHVSETLARFHAAYGREITREVASEFKRQLEDCDPTLLDEATTEWIGISAWLPKPAELLSIIRRLESESSSQPAEPEHWRLDAYKCQICRDAGYVTCWHPRAMQSAIWHVRGHIARDRLQLPTCDARCTCSIGLTKPSGLRRTKRLDGTEIPEPVRYKSPPMLRVDPAMSSADQIEALLAWARSWRPGLGNRVPEFDDF